jgi:hypothetical protein
VAEIVNSEVKTMSPPAVAGPPGRPGLALADPIEFGRAVADRRMASGDDG